MVEQLFHLYYGLENNTWLYFMQYLLWNFLLKLKAKGFSRASIFQFNWITSWVFINRVYINLGFEITMLFSPRFIMYIYGCLHYFFSLIFYPHLMHKLSPDISQFYRSAQLGQESNICDRCGRNFYASPDKDNWITCTLLLKAISCRNWYIIYLPWIFRNAFSSNCCFFLFNKIKILISIWIFLFLGLITINALMKGYYKTISLCIFNPDQLFIL